MRFEWRVLNTSSSLRACICVHGALILKQLNDQSVDNEPEESRLHHLGTCNGVHLASICMLGFIDGAYRLSVQ